MDISELLLWFQFYGDFHASRANLLSTGFSPWPVCMSKLILNSPLSFPLILHRGTTGTDVQRREWRRHFKTDPSRSDPRRSLRSRRPPSRRPRPWTDRLRPSAWGGGACRRGRRGWRSRQRRIAQQIPVKEEEKVPHPVVPKEKQKEVWNPVRKLCSGVRQYLSFKSICFCTVFTFRVSIFLLKPQIVFILLINAGWSAL